MKLQLVPLVVVLMNCVPLSADTVKLNNGDRLSGKIERLVSAKLRFQTTYAGTLEIQWDQIETLSTSEPFVVEFTNGESTTGTIFSHEPGSLQIGSHSPIPVSEVYAIRKEAAVPGFIESWEGSADVGYTLSRGNTTIDNLSFSFQPERKTVLDRIRIQMHSLYSVQQEETSANMHRLQVQYDRFVSSHTFVFVQGRAETDQQAMLAFRTSQGGGLGIEFPISPGTTVSIFGGMTFLQERFQSLERTLSGEGLAGLEFETSRFGPLVIGTRGQILPILSGDRFRAEWTANIRIPVFGGFNLGLQMFDNFNSAPPQAIIRKNDFGLLSTFGLTF